MKVICGFSRETVVAVTTNIESVEFRQRQNRDIGYEEHPRAGTTDDVEAFFALLHRYLGLIFTLKEFKALWRKLVRLASAAMIIKTCKELHPFLATLLLMNKVSFL